MSDTARFELTREEARRLFFEWYLIFVAKDPELLTKEDQRLAERLKNFFDTDTEGTTNGIRK